MPRRQEEDAEPLAIDRAAAAEVSSDASIREWARDKRVFISSVMADLKAERQAAAAAIRDLGARPKMFEEFGGRDGDAEDAYLGEVETSDVYLGILGRRYGKPLPTRHSATHAEYLHAEKSGLRLMLWAMSVPDREGHEQSFLDEARVFHVVPECDSPEELRRQIVERLRDIAAEDLAPWCKLGPIVFRASQVADRGRKIDVTAKIRDDSISHRLEELDERESFRFTWAGRSKAVSVKSVESTTVAARSRSLAIHCEVEDATHHSWQDMSINGMSADDLTEAAIESVLFGKKKSLDIQSMGFLTEMADPLQPLRDAKVSDEIVRPLAELLIVDELVGSGRAARLSEFALGTRIRGERELKLSWQTPKRYSNDRPSIRTVRGRVRL